MYHGHLKAPWQEDPEIYLGKHVRLTLPATSGIGYPPQWSFQDPLRVDRAIPVDGAVTDPAPSWSRSPQARFWLEPEPENIPTLIRRTLKKAARWWSISTARRKY